MVTKNPRALSAKLRRIRMLLLDVDGVLTDGGLYYSADGIELKRFHAHDGYGVVRAHRDRRRPCSGLENRGCHPRNRRQSLCHANVAEEIRI
jgi:hypothetical protein